MKTSSAKAKGRALQKLVRDTILQYYTELEADDVKSTSMGAQGEDIQLSPAARRGFPFSIECKNQEGYKKLYDAYEQAMVNSNGKYTPLLVIKSNREVPLAIMDLDMFVELMSMLYYSTKENNGRNSTTKSNN